MTTVPLLDRQTVELPIGNIEYRAFGASDASATAVFTHGALHGGELWSHVASLLAGRGLRSYIPEWPMGAHRIPARPGAVVSPRSIATSLLAFLDEHGLQDVTLVGGVDGGAINQIAIDIDSSRIAAAVFTNSPAFGQFPPAPIDLLLRMLAHPTRLKFATTSLRSTVIRHSPVGFGLLSRSLDPAMSRRWIDPLLSTPQVRRDLVEFINNVDPSELSEVSARMTSFTKPVKVVWGLADPFFKIRLGERLASAFPYTDLIPVPGARTFVALDAPAVVADAVNSIATS